jgi:hypothetical protein
MTIVETLNVSHQENMQEDKDKDGLEIPEQISLSHSNDNNAADAIDAISISTGSTPPLSQAQLRAKIDSQKELIKGMEKHDAIPIDWPFCDMPTGIYKGVLSCPRGALLSNEAVCPETAAWAVQEDMDDPKSKIRFICNKDFTSLPQHPVGKFYRVFKLSARNYQNLVKRKKENDK